MQNFREFLVQEGHIMTPLQEEFLKSFDKMCAMNEAGFLGATKKFVKSMWSKMVTLGAVAFGPTTMKAIQDEVKSWEKEPGLVSAKNYQELKNRVINVIKGSKSAIKKDHEGTGFLTESNIDYAVLEETAITEEEIRELFTITENQKGLDLIDSLNEMSGGAVKVLAQFGWIGGWLIGAKISALMGWASSFWSAVFIKGIIAQAVATGSLSAAAKGTATVVGSAMAGSVSILAVVGAMAALIVAGATILEKIKKLKGSKKEAK